MGNISKLLNQYLRAKFDTTHNIYKALISNSDNVPPSNPVDPNDMDIGAIANMLEWTRRLGIGLVRQLDLTLSTTKYLNFIVQTFAGIARYSGETDSQYLERVVNFIIAPKVSKASIIKYTIPFSSPGLPQILDASETAFADVSFSDSYSLFQNKTLGSPEFDHYIFPAIATDNSGGAYFFILRLENTVATDIMKVVDLVNRWIASGIRYEIQIVNV